MRTGRRINAFQIILLVILIGVIVATVFNMTTHRLFVKSGKEFIDSVVFYGKNLFGIPVEDAPADVSYLDFDDSIIKSLLPIDFEVFGYKFLATFELMFNGVFISRSWDGFCNSMANLLSIFMLVAVPIILGIFIYYLRLFRNVVDSDPNYLSKPLKIFLKFKVNVIDRIKNFVLGIWMNFKYTKWLYWPFLLLFLYNINIFSLALVLLAWYFYFIFSMNFMSIWYLICKVFICISPLLHPVLWPFWIIMLIRWIIKLKIKRGYSKLEDMFYKNEEFISDNFGVVTGIYGPPGTGKTTSAVAFATQIEVMLREKARSQMMEIRAEFPDFPFRCLEKEVEHLKKKSECVNKIQIEFYFKNKFKVGKNDAIKERINVFFEEYEYNLEEKKNCHYDGLSVAYIEEELVDYAQLYFIYISILAYSTYSIRYDEGIELSHAFPGLKYNFFHRDLRMDEIKETNQSYHANIFDYNLLRLNSQVENVYNKSYEDLTKEEQEELNRLITLFDFGVITISEIAKERGNKDSNRGREFGETNPSNDGLANCLGLIRHLTTVRHQQYGFIIWDDQKISALRQVESAMAEVNIFLPKQTKNKKNTLPLWFFEGIILDWGLTHYSRLYNKYIACRNDQTLFSYFVFRMYAFFYNINRKISNTFGFKRYDLNLSGVGINGGQEQRGESTFYVMDKIVYAGKKFDTAVYSGYFDKLKLQAEEGNNQADSFEGPTATFNELERTHGYMFGELGNTMKKYVKRNYEIKKRRKKDPLNN